MKKQNKWKVTTPQQFEAIKALSEAGASIKVIAVAMGKSQPTISRMLKHDTIEQYHEAGRLERAKYASKAMPVVTPWPTTVLKQGLDQPDQIFDFKLLNENLVNLANKMEKYALACEQLTIAIYALRKTTKQPEEHSKVNFWNRG